MNTFRITLAAFALSATALAHASEITNFPITTSAGISRAEVQAEARKSIVNGALSYNEAGPLKMKAPMSTKTRDEVRKETLSARPTADMVAGSYLIGGM
jgi:hypothetical protein